MRFVKLAAAAVVLGLVALAFGWRLSVLGVTPDLLFVLAAFAALGLRPAEGVPAAACVGLFADFLLGGRLGLMALGFGLGARVVEELRPFVGRWGGRDPGARLGIAVRGGRLFLLVLTGAAVAHGTVAVLGAFLEEAPGDLSERLARAVEIAFLTGCAGPLMWPALALVVGPLSGTFRARALEV